MTSWAIMVDVWYLPPTRKSDQEDSIAFARRVQYSIAQCGGGTEFPHKRIHKATCISPDHTTENQIDHICINKKFRRTMADVRTKKGADIASDYHLVVANLKLKLKKNWTSGQTALQRFNTTSLRDTNKLNEFKIALNNRFQALQD
ncbi:unnamed protein product, partial [Schistosoma mattheei]